MGPANNSPTNNNPTSGVTPSTPPAVNPLQPTSAPITPPVTSMPSTPADVPPVPAAASGVSQMPSMTETLNMVAAEGAAQAAGTPSIPTAGVAPSVNTVAGGNVAAATPAPVEPVTPPAVADPMADAAKDEIVDTLSVASDEPKTAPAVPPIARPTNIDGINSARMPKMPVGSTSSRAAAPAGPNPFADAADKKTPSVSFTDPMTEPEPNKDEPVATPIAASKKKSNKTALIILSVIAFIVAIALAVVLVMELMGVGPFATNNNSGQSSSQSQDSNNTNSNSGNGGSSSNSGSNSTNGGSTGINVDVTPGSIVCNATITDDDVIMDSEFVFNITNNKVTGVTMNAIATDADGNQEETSETRTFEEMIEDGEMIGENEYIGSDGTLKATAEEFAGYIEENLDLSDGSLVCEVK